MIHDLAHVNVELVIILCPCPVFGGFHKIWLNLAVLRQIVRRYNETDILHLLTITSYFASVLVAQALKGIEEPNATFVILQISPVAHHKTPVSTLTIVFKYLLE